MKRPASNRGEFNPQRFRRQLFGVGILRDRMRVDQELNVEHIFLEKKKARATSSTVPRVIAERTHRPRPMPANGSEKVGNLA